MPGRVNAADLPKSLLGRVQRDGRPNADGDRRTSASTVNPSSPPPPASGKVQVRAGWRCERCDLDFIHYATGQRHADTHHGGILQWVVRGLLEAVIRP